MIKIGEWLLIAALILPGGNAIGTPQGRTIELKPLTPIKKVVPLYPENLKNEGVAGEIAILTMIDRKGNVMDGAFIVRHLHPDLDKLALEAVKQWKYQPYVYAGTPISVPTFISVIFDPGDLKAAGQSQDDRPAAGEVLAEKSQSAELRTVLDRCAEYCRTLSEASLFYVCREKIGATMRTIKEAEDVFNYIVLEDFTVSARYAYPVLRRADKATYVNDYQLIRKDGKIQEKRTSSDQMGEKTASENAARAANLPYSGNPIFIPVQLLSGDRRLSFNYEIAGEERIRGNGAYIIGIKPRRKRGEEIKSGRIWVDKKTFRILKAEVELASPAVDDQILEECRRHHLTPHLTVSYDYEVEKNGILFPSRSEIRIEYTGMVRPPSDTKANIDIRYDKYRFFTVETDSKIIR